MNICTHKDIDHTLCGRPVSVGQGSSRVELDTTAPMAVDGHGLVHGGFIFGLADHAAMIAVNDPNVVLGSADVRFLKPVQTEETVVAEATVHGKKDKKQTVNVTVCRGNDTVFEGTFTCFVLNRHVLGR